MAAERLRVLLSILQPSYAQLDVGEAEVLDDVAMLNDVIDLLDETEGVVPEDEAELEISELAFEILGLELTTGEVALVEGVEEEAIELESELVLEVLFLWTGGR